MKTAPLAKQRILEAEVKIPYTQRAHTHTHTHAHSRETARANIHTYTRTGCKEGGRSRGEDGSARRSFLHPPRT